MEKKEIKNVGNATLDVANDNMLFVSSAQGGIRKGKLSVASSTTNGLLRKDYFRAVEAIGNGNLVFGENKAQLEPGYYKLAEMNTVNTSAYLFEISGCYYGSTATFWAKFMITSSSCLCKVRILTSFAESINVKIVIVFDSETKNTNLLLYISINITVLNYIGMKMRTGVINTAVNPTLVSDDFFKNKTVIEAVIPVS